MRASLRSSPLVALLAVFGACGCGTDGGDSDPAATTDPVVATDSSDSDPGTDPLPTPTEQEPLDDRAEVPPAPDGVLEYWFPEQVIPAASEKQLCLYMDKLEEDTYMSMFDAFQGKYGHHLLFFRAAIEQPPGTVKDCTDASGMATLIPAVFPQNFFGTEAMPEGMAVLLKAGTQLVLQSHYVNATLQDIRVRDAIHVHTATPESVTTRLGFYALTDVSFKAQPGKDSVSFDCVVPQDMTFLMAGPHMHEWGDWMKVEAGPPEALAAIVDIPKWESDFRDLPPVSTFIDEPLVLHAGDTVRVTCAWDNDLDVPLGFPKEMCALYGYFYPGTDIDDTWICTP